MGIFSKGPSVYESFANSIQAFGMGMLKLSESDRLKIQSTACGAVERYIGAQSFELKQKSDLITVYRIISGSVGVQAKESVDINAKAMEIDEMIESCIPTNTPVAVMGPIRMVLEEYITGQNMSEIDYEEFDNSPARIMVNTLMFSISLINSRCLEEPRKHNSTEVMCFSGLARACAIAAKEQLPKKG
jgi:hypothetical protein